MVPYDRSWGVKGRVPFDDTPVSIPRFVPTGPELEVQDGPRGRVPCQWSSCMDAEVDREPLPVVEEYPVDPLFAPYKHVRLRKVGPTL